MKLALERLYSDEDGQFAAFSTATALEQRKLVRIGSQQTGGRKGFPEYWITLTATGCRAAYLQSKGIGMEHPLITGGGNTLRAYALGAYKAVLVERPDSVGPIKYRYVLIVFLAQGKEPVMFVTSEQNAMQAELFKIARETLNDPSLEHDPENFFLGVFSKSGRRNLGGSPSWGDLQKFEERALHLVRSEFRIVESASVTPAASPKSKKSPSAPGLSSKQPRPRNLFYGSLRSLFLGLSWLFAGLAVAFMVYVLVVNPREFFSNILNPLWLVYFAPAIFCFWGASWAQRKRDAHGPAFHALLGIVQESGGFLTSKSAPEGTTNDRPSVIRSILAVFLACIIFAVAWFVIYYAFEISRVFRNDENIIQVLFNAMASIGISAYVGLAGAGKAMKRIHPALVWWAFVCT